MTFVSLHLKESRIYSTIIFAIKSINARIYVMLPVFAELSMKSKNEFGRVIYLQKVFHTNTLIPWKIENPVNHSFESTKILTKEGMIVITKNLIDVKKNALNVRAIVRENLIMQGIITLNSIGIKKTVFSHHNRALLIL